MTKYMMKCAMEKGTLQKPNEGVSPWNTTGSSFWARPHILAVLRTQESNSFIFIRKKQDSSSPFLSLT